MDLMVNMGVKTRGDLAFDKIIKWSNNFTCFEDYSLTEENGKPHIRPIHESFFETYTSMISTINGMSVEKYLEKEVPFTYERQVKEYYDKCQESLHKDYYNAIKQAYKKGLVKLKDFGEE
jgi:hypothetical protein